MSKLLTIAFVSFSSLLFNVKASGQIINTIAGNGTSGYSGDGSAATSAQLHNPYGLALDAKGNVFIADMDNNRIRKVDTSGVITTIAGTGIAGYGGDSVAATSTQLNIPLGVAVDASGNVYIADWGNNEIRKVDALGIINTIAGTGVAGNSGDSAAATLAQLNHPHGLALDASGNLYIADWGNNKIRKVDTSGIITTIAGTGVAGFGGDSAAATSAKLNAPTDVAVDASGNVFIVDASNNRIRKIDTAGIITTIAGMGFDGYNGDNIPATSAQLSLPEGLAIDAAGNVYIADWGNNRIRKVDTSGVITTIAGTGLSGYSGDGGPATSSYLNNPTGVAVDAAGNLYIADKFNYRVRKVTVDPLATIDIRSIGSNNLSLSLYPNPNDGSFTVKGTLANKEQHRVTVEVYNTIGQAVYRKEFAVSNGVLENKIELSKALPAGNYFLKLNDGNSSITRFTITAISDHL